MVSENSMVKVDYVASASGRVFDTTDVEQAKANGIHFPEARYVPITVALGKKHVIPGFEEALQKAEVGKLVKVEIPAEKAYGQRNPDLVRVVPLAQFQKQGIEPVPGMPLDLDGTPARVQSVSGGRVRVDFNHELAGLSLVYEFTIRAELKTALEKLNSLADELFAGGKATFDAAIGTAQVQVPPEVCLSRDYLQRKGRFLSMALSFIQEVKTVKVTEEFNRQNADKAEGNE